MIGLAAVCGIGTFCMLFFRSHPNTETNEENGVPTPTADVNTPLISDDSVLQINGDCQITTSVVVSNRYR